MTVPLLKNSDAGLILGYAFAPGQPPRELGWQDCMEADPTPPDGFLWLHLNVAMQKTKHWLSGPAALPEAAVEALLDNDGHSHMVLSPNGFLLTLNDLNASLEGERDGEAIGSLRVWVDRKRVITVRRRPKMATQRLHAAIEAGNVPDSSIALFLELMEAVADNLGRVTNDLLRQIDAAEDAFLAGRTQGLRQRLGALRREAVTLYRLVAPDRQAIGRLHVRLHHWLEPDELEILRQAFDDISALADDVREAQDRAKVLQEEFAALLAEETNRNLYTLSIASVVLLPMTLVTGYFGMNTGSLPFGMDHADGTLMATVIMMAVGIITGLWVHLYFRGNRRS